MAASILKFIPPGREVDVFLYAALLWIADADGDIDSREMSIIEEAVSLGGSGYISEVARVVRDREKESLLLVCDFLKKGLTDKGKLEFLRLALLVAVADGRLSISEIHILQLYSDMLGVIPARLRIMYKEIVGNNMPEPGDPSSMSWWESKEKRSYGGYREEGSNGRKSSDGNKDSMTIAEAYVVLGLRPGASKDEIKSAYRRMAQSHHPDRFVELGLDAKKVSEVMFARIRRAYEVLSK
jgi:DnaJ-domain-containing protein 1